MNSQIRTKKTWQRHLPQRAKRVQRDYYSNQKNTNTKKVVRIIWIIVAILAIQSIFQAPYFKVDQIEIAGNQDLSYDEVYETVSNELTASRFLVFKNNNYFLLKTEPIEDILVEKYNLDQATLDKDLPDKLLVTLKEKISHFIWQKDDSLYLLGAKGRLNRQIGAIDEKYLILADNRDHRPTGEQIFDENEINVINQIYIRWNDLISDKAKLQKIVIYNDWALELYTDVGYHVKIDRDVDIVEQINILNRVLTETIGGVDIDYIDVRFGDKVYFK